jgi:hypothetical protein
VDGTFKKAMALLGIYKRQKPLKRKTILLKQKKLNSTGDHLQLTNHQHHSRLLELDSAPVF